MSGNPGEGMSERPMPTGTSPCSKNEKVGSRTPVSSLDLSKEAPASKPTDADPSRLAHTAVNPSNEVGTIELAEDSGAEEERKSRTVEFELRARKMGITRQESIAEKVAIWEGMWAAGQTGNDIQYCAGILLDIATDVNEDWLQYGVEVLFAAPRSGQ